MLTRGQLISAPGRRTFGIAEWIMANTHAPRRLSSTKPAKQTIFATHVHMFSTKEIIYFRGGKITLMHLVGTEPAFSCPNGDSCTIRPPRCDGHPFDQNLRQKNVLERSQNTQFCVSSSYATVLIHSTTKNIPNVLYNNTPSAAVLMRTPTWSSLSANLAQYVASRSVHSPKRAVENSQHSV